MPKKQPKNAFYFFMKDYREEQEQMGYRFQNGLKEVAEMAGPVWRELPAHQRLPYEEKAAEAKLKDKGDLSNKFTTTGISYAQLQKEESERRHEEMKMRNEIMGTVQGLDRGTTLKSQVFYFIHFNYYCRIDDGHYLICEVALAQFSLLYGIKDIYHTIVRQDRIPTGYSFEAKSTSDETHKIPLPHDLEEGESPHGRIFFSIKSFLEENKLQNGDIPPIYTIDTHVDVAQSVLTTMAEFHYPQNPDIFRVYPLSKLFFHLRNAATPPNSPPGFPVETLAIRELDKDQYNFAPGIACHFHEKTDSCVFCSKSIVTRWGFLICDHCCQDLKIPVVRGKHVPLNAAISETFEDDGEPFIMATRRGAKAHAAKSPSSAIASTSSAVSSASSASSSARARSFADSIVNNRAKVEALPVPLHVVDYAKEGPPEETAHHFNINPDSLPVSAKATGNCWGVKPELAPLRRPQRLPSAMQDAIPFTNEDFPEIGSRKLTPAAVAGRGRGRARILQETVASPPGGLNEDTCSASYQVVAGRGRPRPDGKIGSRLAANLQGLNIN